MEYMSLNSLNIKQILIYFTEVPALHSDATAHDKASDS